MTDRLYLPNVTLVVLDSMCHRLTAMAIRDCLKHAVFAAINIHTNSRDQINIEKANYFDAPAFAAKEDVMLYLWREVPQRVETSHFLFIQWDSWILDASCWREDWLQYDYIGAPWPFHQENTDMIVGNGGFSLRSTALMRYVAEQSFDMPTAEDHLLCRDLRPQLEAMGFRWAPTEVASEFAFECEPYHRAFGFHGIFNWPYLMSRREIQTRLKDAPQYVRGSYAYEQMCDAMKARVRQR
jgi:hypothetical protein